MVWHILRSGTAALFVIVYMITSGKAVQILDNCVPDSMHGMNGALREADLSDSIEERKWQLEEEKREAEKL